MDIRDLETIAQEQKYKFEYAFASVIFGTLALSLQFTGKIGHHFPYCLVSGWIALFISVCSCGYRLMYFPVFLQMNVHIRDLELRRDILQTSVSAGGSSTDPVSGKVRPKSETIEMLKTYEKCATEGHANFNTQKIVVELLWKVQLVTFIFGLALIGIFTIANFLHSSKA